MTINLFFSLYEKLRFNDKNQILLSDFRVVIFIANLYIVVSSYIHIKGDVRKRSLSGNCFFLLQLDVDIM